MVEACSGMCSSVSKIPHANQKPTCGRPQRPAIELVAIALDRKASISSSVDTSGRACDNCAPVNIYRPKHRIGACAEFVGKHVCYMLQRALTVHGADGTTITVPG